MAHYMLQASYTPQAWAALAKNPEDRAESVKSLIERAGGKFSQLFFAFGDYDVVVLFEAPDSQTAATLAIAAVSAGHLRSVKTTPLMTAREGMEIMRKASGLSYKPPKG